MRIMMAERSPCPARSFRISKEARQIGHQALEYGIYFVCSFCENFFGFLMKALWILAAVSHFLAACSLQQIDPDLDHEGLEPAGNSAVLETAISPEIAMRSVGFKSVSADSASAYMDARFNALQQQVHNARGVNIWRRGYDIVISMQSAQAFNSSDVVVKPNFGKMLDRISTVLNEYENTVIRLTGHSVTNGGVRFNKNLSEFRADAIAEKLKASGVAPVRIDSIGEGEKLPVASNVSFVGRPQNTRTDLTISPLTGF
jgi:outer membrane protein OmpA-like peptidoglycan-associated protein